MPETFLRSVMITGSIIASIEETDRKEEDAYVAAAINVIDADQELLS